MGAATLQRSEKSETSRNPRDLLLAAMPVTERRLNLNGVSTAVLEGGDGPPMVLLHGPGAYGAQWIGTIPALATTHRVIAPDLPGHGASASFEGAPSPERVIGWLDDLIECTCSKPPVLVGHALGGAVAMRYAADAGRPLAALVLVDTLGLAAFQPAPALGAALQAFLQVPNGATHDGLWDQCVHDFNALKQRLGEQWIWIRAYNLAGMQTAGASMLMAWMEQLGMPATPSSVLERIRTPTTLIWGRNDLATPLSVAQAAREKYGWGLQVIDGAAADPMIEQPDALVDALRKAIAPV